MNPDWEDAEIEQCAEDAMRNWWHVCMGDYCGAKLPEGVCAQKCIPPFEEDIMKCDGEFVVDSVRFWVGLPNLGLVLGSVRFWNRFVFWLGLI